MNAKIAKILASIFKFWAKKETSKYIRLGQFFRNMVVFGLVPHSKYLQNVLFNFSEKIEQPKYSYVTLPNPVEDAKARAQVKPYNKFFVYSLKKDGTLTISHISLEAI